MEYESIYSAARDGSPISGLTHNFYRYPARFSPQFAQACIDTFTDPGDLVLDPFCGGGTTLVEALSAGRHAIGCDINELAIFVSRVKTTPLSKRQLQNAVQIFEQLHTQIKINTAKPAHDQQTDARLQKHLGYRDTWRIRKLIAISLAKISKIRCAETENLLRCSILKTAQWALDGRKNIPSVDNFRSRLELDFNAVLLGACEYVKAYSTAWDGKAAFSKLIHCSASVIDKKDFCRRRVGLVLTSPPYPGIHVLYHRWQIKGRLETPAPYWIANTLDGAGSSYYTMGDRHQKRWDVYFDQAQKNISAVRKACTKGTYFVQMIGFSNVTDHFRRYLSLMKETGFEEVNLNATSFEKRIWRDVPNRKWHADQKGATPGSREVVLVHRAT